MTRQQSSQNLLSKQNNEISSCPEFVTPEDDILRSVQSEQWFRVSSSAIETCSCIARKFA